MRKGTSFTSHAELDAIQLHSESAFFLWKHVVYFFRGCVPLLLFSQSTTFGNMSTAAIYLEERINKVHSLPPDLFYDTNVFLTWCNFSCLDLNDTYGRSEKKTLSSQKQNPKSVYADLRETSSSCRNPEYNLCKLTQTSAVQQHQIGFFSLLHQ